MPPDAFFASPTRSRVTPEETEMGAPQNIQITYDPNNATTKWSASQQPIVITPGTTLITWTIGLATGATGAIVFDTNQGHPGIEFGSDWPGPAPTGNATSWSVDATDSIQPNQPSKRYHYKVNAIFTAAGSSNGNRVKWDPDVQMDPP